VELANRNSTLALISVIFSPLFLRRNTINNKITHPHCNLLIKIFNWLLLARQPVQRKNRIGIAFLLPRINRGCGDAKSLINNLIEIFTWRGHSAEQRDRDENGKWKARTSFIFNLQ